MPSPDQLRLHAGVRAATEALRLAEEQAADLAAGLVQARASGSASTVSTAALGKRVQAALAEVVKQRAALQTQRQQTITLAGQSAAAGALARLDPKLPLLLLPVRLETRFRFVDAAGAATFTRPISYASTQLLIRIFPDDLASDAHEPGLTENEHAAGTAYWQEMWRARGAAAAELDAWRRLLTGATPQRAAWIAHVLTPTNLAQGPRGLLPQFPSVARRAAAWTRPARARCLPDAWQAVANGQLASANGGVDATFTAASGLVRHPLAIGPDPGASGAAAPATQLDVDAQMRWMVDFDEALAAGMALVMSIPGALYGPLSSLLVFGVCGSLDPAASAAEFAGLVDAHHYHDGIALVAQGTPTNSTTAARAGSSSRSTAATAGDTHAIERAAPLTVAAGNDGARLAAALGLPADLVGHLERADAREQEQAQAMITALWPSTIGYYLRELLAPVFSDADVAAMRSHARSHVRARGALPALRIAAQPYGILPVAQLRDPGRHEGVDHRLWEVLDQLLPIWRQAAARVATVAGSQDPERTIVDLLRLDGVPQSFSVRGLLGPQAVNLLQTAGADPAAIAQAREAGHAAFTGLGWNPLLAEALFLPDSADLSAPLVAAATPGGKPAAYLAWLAQADIASIRADRYAPGKAPRTLLYLLTREAVMRAYDLAAQELLAARTPTLPPETWREHEVIDGGLANPQVATIWARLDQPMPGHAGQTIGVFLDHLTQAAAGAPQQLLELREALRQLAKVPEEALALLLAETLALTSHRLDAWISSLAHQRLDEIRAAAPQGLNLGAFGWVELLTPGGGLSVVATPPTDEAGPPLYHDNQNAGYVHAPSLAHAGAAAVLRSAQLSHGASGSAFSVDLSSRRVRAALHLMEGIRSGQPLGALLGYRAEQALHEAGLDRLIAPLRAAFPLTANQLIPGNHPVEAVAANTVVDGLALIRAAAATGGIGWAGIGIGVAADQAAVTTVIAALQDAVDAGGDLVTAEGVYQAVRGNPQRTAAIQDGVSGLDSLPPLPEVISSARSGTGLTHRLATLWQPPATAVSGWGASAQSRPRALAEPGLNAWVGGLLGPADRIRFTIRFVDASGTVLASIAKSVFDLGLAPLDVVALELPADQPQAGELELRAALLAESARTTTTATARVVLVFERDAGWTSDILGLPEASEVVRTIRALIGSARHLTTADLGGPAAVVSDADYDLTELAARLAAATTAFAQASAALRQAAQGRDANALRSALLGIADFGVPGAAPLSAAGGDARSLADLATQAASVLAELDRRAATLAAGPVTTLAGLLTGFETIFGRALRVCPLLRPSARNDGLVGALAGTAALVGSDRGAVRNWLARAATVRPGAARLEAVLGYADLLALGRSSAPSGFAVAQFPATSGDRWIGLPFAAGAEAPGGRVGIVVPAAAALAVGGALAGLAIDEWVETIPQRAETTAISFHYTAPSSCAPQALLLALPPPSLPAWTDALVTELLGNARDLAKLRSVGPRALTGLGQVLPLAVVPDNTAGDTASCSLWQLAP